MSNILVKHINKNLIVQFVGQQNILKTLTFEAMESLVSFLKQFGNKVRKIRTAKNMTQEELCDKAGIFRSQLARIEKGDLNITLKTLKALADALDLDPKELLNF